MSQFAYDKPKTRARAVIMDHILTWCLANTVSESYQPRQTITLDDGWWYHVDDPEIGDLVVQKSAPPSKWRMAWVHDKEPLTDLNRFDRRITLESLDDGELGDWRNCSYMRFPSAKDHPEWRWTDAQFAFRDRWYRAFHGEHLVKAMQPVFNGNAVTLSTRYWMNLDERRPEETFPDWRKVTKPMMADWLARAKQQ